MSDHTIKRFLEGYAGKDLLKKHALTEIGVWKVVGEDSNADLGGHHHQPLIGIFSGMLKDIIDYAVSHPNFWTWGNGGDITTVVIIPIDSQSAERRAELTKRQQELETELNLVKMQLGVQ